MRVICVSGKARHGKDTVAEMLQNILWSRGKRVLLTHNADLLKFMCKNLFGWNGEKDEHGRHILQYVGTDVIRAQEPDFWVDFIVKELELFHDQWDCVLIPDCRFPNEIEKLKHAGHEVIHLRVCRPDCDADLTEEQKMHPSETALDDVSPDYTICNDGTLVDLMASALQFIAAAYGQQFLNGGE